MLPIGYRPSEETKRKMSEAALRREYSPEMKEQRRKVWLGRKHTPETREKMRKAAFGRKFSLETREKLRLAGIGREVSPETRAKIGVAQVGPKGNNWKGGRRILNPGYIKVLSHGHPLSDTCRCVFEHRLVVEAKIGRFLRPSEFVHHINGEYGDNRPENLICFASQRAHVRFERNFSVSPRDIIFDGRLL